MTDPLVVYNTCKNCFFFGVSKSVSSKSNIGGCKFGFTFISCTLESCNSKFRPEKNMSKIVVFLLVFRPFLLIEAVHPFLAPLSNFWESIFFLPLRNAEFGEFGYSFTFHIRRAIAQQLFHFFAPSWQPPAPIWFLPNTDYL